jgi:hypothetical protein
MIFLLLLSFF